MTKIFNEQGYKYTINASYCPKLPSVTVYIKIDTAEKNLLLSLNKKFKNEKLLVTSANGNNGISNMIIGTNGLVFNSPENKFTSVVSQYISYLSKTVVKPNQFCAQKDSVGKYSELEKSLKTVTVTVVGKCKTFIKNSIDKESNKIGNMMKAIIDRKVKDRKDVVSNGACFHECTQECVHGYQCSDSQAVDIISAYKQEDILVTKTPGGIKVCGCFPTNWKVYSDVLRGYLKSFKSQAGSYGSPAANDDGKKWKSKCDEIFSGINLIAFAISDVRGHGVMYKEQDELKIVDSISVKLIASN